MLKNGIPADQIIHMSYDDVASDERNPFKGQLFNKPDGENVYDQSNIDYSGRKVNATNFLAVLTGDEETAGGKVLKSNENSQVFVYYADHGAPGFVAMPTGGYLYADKLQEAIATM